MRTRKMAGNPQLTVRNTLIFTLTHSFFFHLSKPLFFFLFQLCMLIIHRASNYRKKTLKSKWFTCFHILLHFVPNFWLLPLCLQTHHPSVSSLFWVQRMMTSSMCRMTSSPSWTSFPSEMAVPLNGGRLPGVHLLFFLRVFPVLCPNLLF